MASDRKCCVPNCGTSLNEEILHKFPNPAKQLDRFKSWIHAIGGDILGKDDIFIYKNRRVCHKHFESSYCTWSKMLSCDAVPTLHIPGYFVTRKRGLLDVTNENIAENIQDIEMAIPSTSGVQQSTSVKISSDEVNLITGKHDHSLKSVTKTRKPLIASKTQKALTTSLNDAVQLKKVITKLQKSNDNYQSRLRKALKLGENKTFQNALKKFSTMAATFTLMQFREIAKTKMARRFTKEEKIMALTVYKLGPKAYRWLRKIFILPSPVTLSRMIGRASLKPGINENLFKQLEKKTEKMRADDKLCILMFDEMSLSPHLDYNRKKDKIVGFVHNGMENRKKIADHVLVFMIRGITKNYKQPIYYSFCTGSTPKEELSVQIKNVIEKLQSVGFKVLATVCDQGASNVSAINYLIEQTRQEYIKRNEKKRNDDTFEIKDQEVIPLYDVPHLLKGIRNNFISKDLKFTMDGTEKVAKWDHITKLYDANPAYRGLKLIKNLTENHCNPDKIPKMKVKFASQLFSQTVGKTMGFLAENGYIPGECQDTADLLLFFDNLFDSLNGSFNNSSNRSGKELLRNVTTNSLHKKIWMESKIILKTMKFVTTTGKAGVVPSINNWIRTIENMELLRDKLFKIYDIKSFWCRHFNQDPLENFFGSIRSHGLRNNSPTCAAFESAFASLLVNNLASNYSLGSNCEDDMCEAFTSFEELFFSNTVSTSEICEIDLNELETIENSVVDFNVKLRDPRIIASLQYVSGYLLHKAKKIFKSCECCVGDLIEKEPKNYNYLNTREFHKSRMYLTYPSLNLIKLFSKIQDVVDYVIKNKIDTNNLRNYIKTMLYTITDTSVVTCKEHKFELVDFIFDLSCRMFLCNWCRSVNRILSGTRRDIDNDDFIQKLALSYNNKRKKVKK